MLIQKSAMFNMALFVNYNKNNKILWEKGRKGFINVINTLRKSIGKDIIKRTNQSEKRHEQSLETDAVQSGRCDHMERWLP